MTSRAIRGWGAFDAESQARVLRMIRSGMGQREVAQALGVSKNTVAGVWRRYGEPVMEREPTTLADRLDALHSTLDRVLAETVGVGWMSD